MKLTSMASGLSLVLALVFACETAAVAATKSNKSLIVTGKQTITETETEASLAPPPAVGPAAASTAKGHGEYATVTRTDANGNVLNSFEVFAVVAKGLPVADGSKVDFGINGISVGTGVVRKGRAYLLVTNIFNPNAIVPFATQADVLTISDANANVLLTGAFGAVKVETHTIGK